jgi:uncharacterized protein YgbK (DUF1537 family)
MYLSVQDKLEQLPPEYNDELLPSIRREFLESEKTIVVLDDDPTGTQTSYDVVVLTSWSIELIAEELKKKPPVLFILTNSRSLGEEEAVERTLEVGKHLKEAVHQSGRQVVIISRSDSTLRGHFPAEVAAVARALDMNDAAWILVPAFIEGGRLTIEDVHYIVEHGQLVPVSDTPFAKDVVFGYTNADIREWVEEKTKGRIRASEVISVTLDDIRAGGPQAVRAKLKKCGPGKIGFVNAVSFRDLEVFVMGVILAEREGQKFLYRSSATFVPLRAGMNSGKIFRPGKGQMASANGSLVVVGSHVPKTTSQLNYLLSTERHQSIEINVAEILKAKNTALLSVAITGQIEKWITAGMDTVIYTSRKLETGNDSQSSLQINARISDFLVSIVSGLRARPKFIVAKGGITSSDLASKGLSVEKALIAGQIIPGVPVWRLAEKSKFPDMIYVVFPGNVGDTPALAEVCTILGSEHG